MGEGLAPQDPEGRADKVQHWSAGQRQGVWSIRGAVLGSSPVLVSELHI